MTNHRPVWIFLGFGPWSWRYSYCPETHVVRARFEDVHDVWSSIFDFRCLRDPQLRSAWWRAVMWEVRRVWSQ